MFVQEIVVVLVPYIKSFTRGMVHMYTLHNDLIAILVCLFLIKVSLSFCHISLYTVTIFIY